jgi:hypothetical protein
VHCAHELTAFPAGRILWTNACRQEHGTAHPNAPLTVQPLHLAEDTKRMAELFRLTNLERE